MKLIISKNQVEKNNKLLLSEKSAHRKIKKIFSQTITMRQQHKNTVHCKLNIKVIIKKLTR